MNGTPSFWVWNNVIPPDKCNALIEEYYKADDDRPAKIGVVGEGAVNAEYRKTNICWIPTSEAISLFLFSKSLVANSKAGWGFDLEDHEQTQIAKYEDGGHYNWHTDETFYQRNRGYHRKVSSVLFLSDPATYTGGEFLFDSVNGGDKVEANAGTLICFPSEIRHKVMPVTEGVRYSLASWATGPFMR